MPELEIACPKCGWKPKASSKWSCDCGHRWNTFETHGRCPNCTKNWRETQCHGSEAGGCSEWSDHLDWYRNLSDIMLEAIEEALKQEQDVIQGV